MPSTSNTATFLTFITSMVQYVYMSANKGFSEGFLWGASTAAHQVEGGNFNDWTEWEKEEAANLAEKAKTFWLFNDEQRERFPEMFEAENYVSGRASDHYNRFHEDIGIMGELGLRAYRFSIEWSRVEPKRGEFDAKEIEHYRSVIANLKESGIEPVVCLYHFSNPLWVRDMGGWGNGEVAEAFGKFAGKMGKEFGDEMKYWIPLNEPVMYAHMSAFRVGPWMDWPYTLSGLGGWLKICKNFVRGHKLAHKAIKEVSPDANVGVAKAYTHFEVRNKNPMSYFVALVSHKMHNERFVKKVLGELDFVGLNYYTRSGIKAGFSNPRSWFNRNEDKVVSDVGWEVHPDSLYHSLKGVSKFGKPIYVTENGIADAKDAKRAEFIRGHVEAMERAIGDGVDLRGYFHWSLLDNFEWSNGFWPRFGLIEVDYGNDCKRAVRASAREYAKVIKGSK